MERLRMSKGIRITKSEPGDCKHSATHWSAVFGKLLFLRRVAK
jgi:hypothetical protein